jgi:hypothetical protein
VRNVSAVDVGVIIYVIAGAIAGWKFMTGRHAYLEVKKPLNILLKAIVSFAVGQFIAVFYTLGLFIKMLTRFGP